MCSQKVCYTSQPTDLEGDGVVATARNSTPQIVSAPIPGGGKTQYLLQAPESESACRARVLNASRSC